MERAYTAKTYGELALLSADLPSQMPPSHPAYRSQGTNSLAVASLVFGVAELFTAGLTAVPAVVLGHKARLADPHDRGAGQRDGDRRPDFSAGPRSACSRCSSRWRCWPRWPSTRAAGARRAAA